jgi:cholesterol transport system auxiliary component
MKRLAAGLAVVLAGCLSQPRTPEPALYDLGLGPHPDAQHAEQTGSVARVRVNAPSWLDQTAMHYRLLYEEPMRTRSYAYARWLAPPPELLAQRLRQTLAIRAVGVPSDNLEVGLEEYLQLFETPAQSVARITAYVRTAGAGEVRFTEQVPAQTADAAGGAAALAAATNQLVVRIVEWLDAQDGDQTAAKP